MTKRWAMAILFSALLTSRAAGQGLDALISPGPLSRPHSELTGLENCASCHSAGKGVEPQKCLACHVDLGERIRRGSGFHRNKATECVSCHSEHHGSDMQLVRFDPRQLDHRETGYPLLGLHLGVERCEQCHTPARAPARRTARTYLLRDASCTACHQDPHRGELGESCLQCHAMDREFADFQFDHDRSAFPLRGAHQTVACRSCHPGTSFKVQRFSTCQDCHQDPHRPTLGGDCERCHEPSSWIALGTGFDHDATAFPLRGMHRQVACARCHPDQRFKKLSFARCDDCHGEDPHLGQFPGQDCSSCHLVQGFQRTTFEHQKASFPLTGKHADVLCARCHASEEGEFPAGTGKAVRFRPVATTCLSCHPDVHLGQLEGRCEACHTTSGFDREALRFEHQRDARFPLRGRHATLDCLQCHKSEKAEFPAGTGQAVRFKPIADLCSACHANPHDPLGHGESARRLRAAPPAPPECERCHSVETFVRDGYDHELTEFPLRGRHAPLTCERCHRFLPHQEGTILTFRKLDSGCSDCHLSPHSARQNDCRTCHHSSGWSVLAW